MHLSKFNNKKFDRGEPLWFQTIWFFVHNLFFSTWIPGSWWRCILLRIFGAKIGNGIVIKPRVKIKFPWRLMIGDYSWIGEDVWIDNLDKVEIGANCCISQSVYLCTGSHDWSEESFNLLTKPILIRDSAWIGAQSVIAPGVIVNEGAVLCLGSIATEDLQPWSIYKGNPAILTSKRNKDY